MVKICAEFGKRKRGSFTSLNRNIPEMEEKMKQLTKSRLMAVLFSVLPIIIYFLLIVLLSAVCAFAQADYDKVFTFLNAASMAGASVIMCMVLKKRTGKRLKDALSIKQFDICIPLLLLVFSWCAAEAVDGIIAGICSGFMTVTPNAPEDTDVLRIVGAILIAPVFEEILFRFLGMEFAKPYFPLPVLCITNAVCFSLMYGYNVQGFFNVMVFAVCVAYVYLKTGRLLYVMFVHMLHNAICLIDYGDSIFLGSPIYKEKHGFVLGSPQWITLNLTIAIVCAIIYFKKYKKGSLGKDKRTA